MNTRSIIIGTCLVGTLTGLGYLAWYLYGDTEDTDSRADLPEVEQPAAPQHHHKPTKREPSKTTTRLSGKQRPSQTVTRTPIPHKPPQTATRPKVVHKPPQTVIRPKVHRPPPTVTRPQIQQRPQPKGDEFPLRLGSKGKRVERLQVWLMRNFGWTGKITNVFDKKTEDLLKRVLKKTQLDEATYNRMKMGSSVHHQPVYKRTTIRRPVYRKPVYNPMTIERLVHRQPVIQHIRR